MYGKQHRRKGILFHQYVGIDYFIFQNGFHSFLLNINFKGRYFQFSFNNEHVNNSIYVYL